MQARIIRSLLEYPQKLAEFESIFFDELFTGNFKSFVSLIKNTQESLDFTKFEALLSMEEKQSSEFMQICESYSDPLFLDYFKDLNKQFELRRQELIANKLLSATKSGHIMDLALFERNTKASITEILNYNQWEEKLKNERLVLKFKTKIPFIDTPLDGGFEVAQLVLVSGDAEAGKTALCTQIIENIASYAFVCFFCLEFTVKQYINRREKIGFNKNNFFIINNVYNIHEVARHISIMAKRGCKVFLIDSQLRLESKKNENQNMEQEESLKFSILAKLAHSLELLIFLIIQTAKGDRDNAMGSKKATHEANIILRLERIAISARKAASTQLEYEPNERFFYIRKNKQTGKHFKEPVYFNTEELRFYPLQNEAGFKEITFNEIDKELF